MCAFHDCDLVVTFPIALSNASFCFRTASWRLSLAEGGALLAALPNTLDSHHFSRSFGLITHTVASIKSSANVISQPPKRSIQPPRRFIA